MNLKDQYPIVKQAMHQQHISSLYSAIELNYKVKHETVISMLRPLRRHNHKDFIFANLKRGIHHYEHINRKLNSQDAVIIYTNGKISKITDKNWRPLVNTLTSKIVELRNTELTK